jgi:hypothetical protein
MLVPIYQTTWLGIQKYSNIENYRIENHKPIKETFLHTGGNLVSELVWGQK